MTTLSVKHSSQLESFPLTYDAYTITGFIGKGAFAKVYAANCIAKSRTVAIKVIKLEDEEVDGLDVKTVDINDIIKEASVMSSFNHDNVVCCYASFVVNYELWLVMPFICGGSCGQIMHYIPEYTKGIKDQFILSSILRDVISALNYIHNQGLLHRDVKGGNILLHENGNAMLADFGVSGALIENGLRRQGMNTVTGTLCWMSPEIMRQEQYNHKTDMWSFGITALEIAFNTTPYTQYGSPFKVMKEVTEGKCPTVDSMGTHEFHKYFQQMIGKLLVKDPTKRISAKELLDCNFVRKFAVKDKSYIIEHIVNRTKSKIVKKCKEEDFNDNNNISELQKVQLSFSYSATIHSEIFDDNIKETNNTNESLKDISDEKNEITQNTICNGNHESK